jgi:sugar lactone lactonase YvrE
MTAKRLLSTRCVLGEGPVQLRSGELAWVDILRGEIHRWDRARNTRRVIATREPVGAIAETTAGSLIAACRSGLRHIEGDEGPGRLVIALPDPGGDLRMNDGKADPAGRLVGGTMTLGDPRPRAGSLWSWRDGAAVELVAHITISNGLAWSADGSTLFFIDSPTRRIDAFSYDLATGSVTNRRTLVELPEGVGTPDGMCIDAEGGLWVALWGGSAVHRYVGGRLAATIELPTPYVTCPTFAGPELDELVITTASEPFVDSGSEVPDGAGDLYTARPGIRGVPAHLVSLDVLLGRR